MTHDEIIDMIEKDFGDISGPREALDAAYKGSNLSQKYIRILREEQRKLNRMENVFYKIKEVLYRTYRTTEKNTALKLYKDDLKGLEDIDFGFDPLMGPDKIPPTEESKDMMAKGNKAYLRYSTLVKDQRDIVEIIEKVYNFQVKHRHDWCKLILEDTRRNS